MEAFKNCFRCRNEQPLSYFYNNKSAKDGLQRECNTCRNEYYKNKLNLFPKIQCTCARTISKYYLEKHLKTNYHNATSLLIKNTNTIEVK
jgi:cell fate regulator YaaT (PSP1 superfamily)